MKLRGIDMLSRGRFVLLIAALLPGLGSAQEFLFFDDFESAGGLSTGNAWQFQAPASQSNLTGMMFGPGDIYSIRETGRANSGQHVLELNFDGRNGYCNTCGNSSHTLTATEADSGCINANGAPWGDSIWNRGNGFSRWPVTSQTASTICFNRTSPTGNSLWGANNLSSGDEIKLVPRCGTNGTVGGNPSRRSDCNLAINYLNGVDGSDIRPGEALARRMYIYIPSSTELPNIGIKLGYTNWRPPSGGTVSVIPVISVSRGSEVFVNRNAFFEYSESGINIQRDTWYYLEEVFQRESSSGGNNGSYTLYLSRADDPNPNQPVVTHSGIAFGEIDRFSIIGNWQHSNDATGGIYFDDIAIAKSRIGPTDQQPRPLPIAWE